jgi:hypothetical protein
MLSNVLLVSLASTRKDISLPLSSARGSSIQVRNRGKDRSRLSKYVLPSSVVQDHPKTRNKVVHILPSGSDTA